MALELDRVYDTPQTSWAGAQVVTSGKSEVKQDGTDAYAMAVVGVDGSGIVSGLALESTLELVSLEATQQSVLASLTTQIADLALIVTATQSAATNLAAIVANTADVIVAPTASQNPVYDHSNGGQATVTASQTLFTPPAGCQFAEIYSTLISYITTDGTTTAAADGKSITIPPSTPRIIPVIAGTIVKAYAPSSTVVNFLPMKVRP